MEVNVMHLTEVKVNRDTEVDKYALKVLGISYSEENNEKILESLSEYILPSSIKALVFDSFNNFYVLFLTDIKSFRCLVGKTLKFEAHCIEIYPLHDYFHIETVYPSVSNSQLHDIFSTYGTVFRVSNLPVAPNSSKFSHVISGQREIIFVLPGKERKVCIPLKVAYSPHSFNVRRFCCACLEEGHSALECPTLNTDPNSQIIKCDVSENDSKLESSIKLEESHSDEDYDVELPGDSDEEFKLIQLEEGPSIEISNSEDPPSELASILASFIQT